MRATIRVPGVGGGGCNTAANMLRAALPGVEVVACNTDVKCLEHHPAERKIHLGPSTTRGLGAGGRPAAGQEAAEEVQPEIARAVEGAETSLGRWAASQRDHKAKGRLAPEYIKRLEKIGFPWEAMRPAEQDDDLVDHLLEFFREHGHFVVPNTAPHEGLYGRIQDRLPALPKRPRFKQELLPLGFPMDKDEWAWERSFASVKAFRGRNGHCRLPEGSVLGRWLDEQRELAAREDLDLDREARLKNAGILAGNGGTA